MVHFILVHNGREIKVAAIIQKRFDQSDTQRASANRLSTTTNIQK